MHSSGSLDTTVRTSPQAASTGGIFEEGGNQSVAFVLDLTERKRTEKAATLSTEALRRSEAYLLNCRG